MTTVLIVAHVLGFVSSIAALRSSRTSQGAIAWIVALNTFPWVVVPAYWMLGQSRFKGYVSARSSGDHRFRTALSWVHTRIEPFVREMPPDTGRLDALERLARMPFTSGNHARLLINGEATFRSIFDGIDAARAYVLVQFFIVHDDGLGRDLQQRLIAKARTGVPVFFLYDEIGSYSLPRSYLRALRHGGVHVSSFHSSQAFTHRFQIVFRNHRKVVVVDGKVGWLGGHNVADVYLGAQTKLGRWRDTHLCLEGPAVLGLQLSFMEDWFWATREMLDLEWNPRECPSPNQKVLILPSGPADSCETASLMVHHAINSARTRFWIASPYFVPDEGVQQALHLAALRGVDVRVLIPENPDHWLVYLSAYAFVGDMIRSGVHVHRYGPGFLHQKVFLVDDWLSGVGSVNVDSRSFRLHFEITALTLGKEFASEVETMLQNDLAQSREMTLKELERRPWRWRVASSAAYLTAPVL
jgi:cardiolipin synthase A/B